MALLFLVYCSDLVWTIESWILISKTLYDNFGLKWIIYDNKIIIIIKWSPFWEREKKWEHKSHKKHFFFHVQISLITLMKWKVMWDIHKLYNHFGATQLACVFFYWFIDGWTWDDRYILSKQYVYIFNNNAFGMEIFDRNKKGP